MITTKHRNKRNIRMVFYWAVILIIGFSCTCAKQTNILATDKSVNISANSNRTATPDVKPTTLDRQATAEKDSPENNQTNPLKKLLAEASWESVNEAKRQGKSALPIIRPFLEDEKYQVRQMAVASAGAVGVDEASDILSAGLKDANINVRLAAAKELAKQAYPSATETVLEIIKTSPDETVRELLVKAAGYLPGDKTVSTLRPLAKGNNVVGDQAKYALAKLGDSTGVNLVSGRLSSASARTRYETLQNLCYINNGQFVPKAKNLLSDKAEAIRVGSVRNFQMRRVADGAVDSLACQLNLELSFNPPKNIYTDEEINEVRNLIN